MECSVALPELVEKISYLETRVKHLSNELRLTREEYESATVNYFELFSHMEKKVEERTMELNRLHSTLQKKNQDLQIMLDAAPGMIFYKNRQCRYIRVNKKFLDAFGVDENQIIGRTHGEIFPDQAGGILDDDLALIRSGRPLLNRTGAIHTIIGERTIMVNQVPDKDSKGAVTGVFGFSVDITDLTRAESEKKELQKRIVRAEKMESIGTLAGGIAHNFNNILMAIQGYASLMLLDTETENPHHRMLKNIEKQVESGSRLTNQLIGYAREGKYEVRSLVVNHLIRDIAETFSITRRDIHIQLDLSDKLHSIIADRGQIEQIIMNLMVNAADAMPRGGDLIVLTRNLSHEELPLRPFKMKKGAYVQIIVKDSGIGIGKDIIEHIFEPFFTTKGLSKGTGLGLTSVYGIVKAHGGYIDVESEKGKGASFIICLPAHIDGVRHEKTRSKELAKGSETVLLVDDEAAVLDVAEGFLKHLGYRVLVAGNGSEAMNVFSRNGKEIDLVILDMLMKDSDGQTLFQRIRETDNRMKVILSKASDLKEQQRRVLLETCDGFIKKPFTLEALSHKIREVLISTKETPAPL
jgi:two-component system, cell cycle sensor histidine kinase and response regulator CckA